MYESSCGYISEECSFECQKLEQQPNSVCIFQLLILFTLLYTLSYEITNQFENEKRNENAIVVALLCEMETCEML